MSTQILKVTKGKEVGKAHYLDTTWRSYYNEQDPSQILREFNSPYRSSSDYYLKKFIESHISLLVLAELGLAPEGELFVCDGSATYIHKDLNLFQTSPGADVLEEFLGKLDAAGIITPPEISFSRLGVDPSDGNIKIFDVESLVVSHLPLEELLVKIKNKIHGFEATEYTLMEPAIEATEDYESVLKKVRDKDWIGWANNNIPSFLDMATSDEVLRESYNLPFLKRMFRTGGAPIRFKKV